MTAGTTVLAFVGFTNTSNNSSMTVTYGGTAMTQIGTPFLFGTHVYSSATYYDQLAVFKLENAPGGSQNVVVTPGVFVSSGLKIGLVSYSGVGSVSAKQTATGTGTGMSQTVTSSPGNVVVQAFQCPFGTGTVSGYNQTSRWNVTTSSYNTAMIVGEAAGASSVTFTGTQNAANLYGGVAVELTPAATVITPSPVTISLTGGTPPLNGQTVIMPTAASLSLVRGTPLVAGTSSMAFDSVAGSAVNGAGLSLTATVTAGSTALLLVNFTNAANNTTISATFGGTAMTQVGTPQFVGTTSGGGYTYYSYQTVFKLPNAPGGAKAVVITPAVTSQSGIKAAILAYVGVGDVGNVQFASGTGPNLSHTFSSASGHILAHGFFAPLGTGVLSGYSGRERYDVATSAWNVASAFGDIDGASTVTVSATASASGPWGSIAVDLTPANPNITVKPTSAVLTLQGGSSSLFGYMLGGKLGAGQNVIVQVIGDSTAYGSLDEQWSSQYGWPGRLCIALGQYYNANVRVLAWNYPSNTAYNPAVTIYTSLSPSAPTITLMLGGWPGATGANYLGQQAAMLPVSNPDVVLINTGFNETSLSAYLTNYQSLMTVVNTRCPGAPIIVTTQNPTTIANEQFHSLTFAQIFGGLVNLFVPGSTLPLVPALQQSPVFSNTWILDTKQIPGWTASDLNSDGLHPNASGYAKQAAYMFAQLVQTSTDIGGNQPVMVRPTSAALSLTRGTATLGRKVLPTGAVLTLQGGSSGVAIGQSNLLRLIPGRPGVYFWSLVTPRERMDVVPSGR
ncbi:hypothetical protein CG716_05450 [Mycolicibacterium sphagni]|uniref:Uncharacterized protein n=1 Tax=Mycolicibacterium sphagni TaxID=1786 RepID=A0A255DQW0_9MYCO|nr:hypothetical protein CG716_05450 [Mycolicibacterium sphagni]